MHAANWMPSPLAKPTVVEPTVCFHDHRVMHPTHIKYEQSAFELCHRARDIRPPVKQIWNVDEQLMKKVAIITGASRGIGRAATSSGKEYSRTVFLRQRKEAVAGYEPRDARKYSLS